MNFSPFSCPIFLGHPEARGRCSQGERVLYGRDLCCSGGTGKAEAAKLPGAGIGPKPCPEKCTAEKRMLTKLGENRSRNASSSATTVGGGENRSYRSPPQVRRVSGVKRIGNLGH